LSENEVPIFFNHGLMLHEDELKSDDHLKATYVEFLEAYARVCDEASIGEGSIE